jgi:hypothetical protein
MYMYMPKPQLRTNNWFLSQLELADYFWCSHSSGFDLCQESVTFISKFLVWVYKSVVRQKLVKTFDSNGFKFRMVKAEYMTLTFFSVPRAN